MKRLVISSDTHSRHSPLSIPDGDVFIHAGDFTHNGTREESADFARWLGRLPHTDIILVPGNHDRFAADNPGEFTAMLPPAAWYLVNSFVSIFGIGRIYGLPQIPAHLRFRGMPFTVSDSELRTLTDAIPVSTPVVVAHCPPTEIFRRVREFGNPHLLKRMREIDFGLLVCGHIHQAWGVGSMNGKMCINASAVDRGLLPRRPVRVVDWYAVDDVRLIQ